MAGARARKLDLTALINGGSHVANLIARAGESEAAGISGMFNGIASGITRARSNAREDKQLALARADRQQARSDSLAERTYQHGQDAFRTGLALKADARADADQRIQEADAKRKIAADAMSVHETVDLLTRAKAAAATGMPMDPKVLEEIQRRSTAIIVAGGPAAVMGRAAAQEEPDPEGLIQETAKFDTLSKLLLAQMGREKDPARHAALGDSLMQLEGLIAANKHRITIHDANVNRKVTKDAKDAEAQQKASNEMTQFQNRVPDAIPDLSQDEMGRAANDLAAGGTAEAIIANLKGERERAVKERTAAESKARQDERLGIAMENHDLAVKGFKLSEESAARAVQSGNIADYEKIVTDSEQKVSRLKDDVKLAISANTNGEHNDNVRAAKDLYDAAVVSMERIQSNRPKRAASGGAVWTEADAKEAARAESEDVPEKRDAIIAKWKRMIGKPKK